MAKQKADYYRAKEGFGATMPDGEVVHVAAGEIVSAGHSIMKRREDLFEPVDSFGRFDVEQATAAPGEKRGDKPKKRGRPKKKAEPAAAIVPPPPKPSFGLKTSDVQPSRPVPE